MEKTLLNYIIEKSDFFFSQGQGPAFDGNFVQSSRSMCTAQQGLYLFINHHKMVISDLLLPLGQLLEWRGGAGSLPRQVGVHPRLEGVEPGQQVE